MSSSLSHDDPEFWISLGQTLLCYRLDPTGAVELLILPGACRDQVCDRQFNRPTHPFLKAPGQGVAQQEKLADSLVQVAIRGLSGPGNWVAGGTMRNQEASRSLRFVGQKVSRSVRADREPASAPLFPFCWRRGLPGRRLMGRANRLAGVVANGGLSPWR